ncbi:hypothetical protein [Oscillibacter sp. GMB15532]|uniref:hypothetical protein n=1 Tax=Oscillibacter sp. GMB15532 TaxID=3230022 RepID=UPI0034DEA68A
MNNKGTSRNLLLELGFIDKDGEPNEDAINEIALEAFCNVVEQIRKRRYSTEQVKQIIRDCESLDDWSNLYFFLSGYYTGSNIPNSDIGWALINDELTFYVYRYYFREMVDCLDQVLPAKVITAEGVCT